MENPDYEIDKYWKNNFNNDKVVNLGNDLQANIARTKNGKSINQEDWNRTVQELIAALNITANSNVLELCCGNGVLLGEIAPYCGSAIGVDYSKRLLEQLRKRYSAGNIQTINADVREYKIAADFFDSIIIYFSIQHFNERDTFLLLEKCIRKLKDKGQVYIGDIPDLDKKWNYIDKKEYHRDYFRRVVSKTPKIGYWFQKDFFIAMNSCFPDVTFQIISQPSYQINSDHCFDVLIRKNGIK
jgi:cyclopropane fatty-acyl-phospholipid synthase-like methyltransferase